LAKYIIFTPFYPFNSLNFPINDIDYFKADYCRGNIL